MTGRETRRKVREFRKEYGVRRLDLSTLEDVLQRQGFTLVPFNGSYNDEDVAALIEALNLRETVSRTRCFTYMDQEYRLVFYHEDLSEEERLIVLSHEEGHIFLGHMSFAPVIGRDVQEEFAANEFAHYLLKPDAPVLLREGLRTHKKPLIAAACVLLAIFALLAYRTAAQEQSYYGEYYVTETGTRFHRKDCSFIRGKDNLHRLTLEEFESGKYEPCGVCLPDGVED